MAWIDQNIEWSINGCTGCIYYQKDFSSSPWGFFFCYRQLCGTFLLEPPFSKVLEVFYGSHHINAVAKVYFFLWNFQHLKDIYYKIERLLFFLYLISKLFERAKKSDGWLSSYICTHFSALTSFSMFLQTSANKLLLRLQAPFERIYFECGLSVGWADTT